MTQVRVEMPEQDSYGEIMKGYLSLMRGLGIDLHGRCDTRITELDGPEWWADLEEQRRTDGIWKGRINPQDPSVLLPEYFKNPDSPLRRALSGKPDSVAMAKKVHYARNTWLHFSENAGAAQLEEVAGFVKQFASMNGLPIEALATRMVRRLQRIRTGQYRPFSDVIRKWQIDNEAVLSPDAEPESPVMTQPHEPNVERPAAENPEPPSSDADVIEIETPAVERRPAIGARWTGEIPAARYVPSAIGDLVDPATGDGLRKRVDAELWPRKRRVWLAPRPLGGVWVDERDGAVGGFVDNVPRLLGYLGDEPDDGLARGFLTPHYYEAVDGRIVDLDSGITLRDAVPADTRHHAERLQAEVLAATPEHTALRLTTYGDLVAVTDEGAVRVAVVEPEQWFGGHLA
ncbi:hypothetical protein [Chryseoglobus sp. 28M-23]|uniref:hypothetical protein n=1 Tax=Chryseoglobus sp. 28M-23 TaxID=2772253 RepID=UPI001746B035|nr:hypothetical protein [Chryseoglobus sp. 28M-23]QOD94548.1 hypothetical protein IE160_04935 [Chryseoglobus sp. 28M-23]